MDELKRCPFCGCTKINDGTTSHDHKSIWCDTCFASTIGETLDEAAATWNRRVDGWVSVEDGLPEPFKPVLIFQTNKSITIGRLSVVEFDFGPSMTWKNTYGKIATVTHWMPLPQPPKEGE